MPTKGLIHSAKKRAIRRWDASCPPFYTLVLNRAEVTRGYRPFGGRGHHVEVRERMKHVALDGPDSYLVNVHGENDSTTFERGQKPELTGAAYEDALARFGLS